MMDVVTYATVEVWEWISNFIPHIMDVITYATVEVWEWINNVIPHIIMDMLTYPLLVRYSANHDR